MRRPVVLGGLLVVAVGCFLALRPTLDRLKEDARRMDRETDQVLAKAGDLAQRTSAVEALQAATAANPSDANAWMQLASAAQEAGRIDVALEAARKAVALGPTDPTPLLALADIQQRGRRYDEAIATYRLLLSREPHLPRAVAGLSFIYLAMGWTLEARDLLEAALRTHPKERPLRTALALASIQHNDFKRAESLLLELRKEDPSDPSLWGALTDMYLKASRPADALSVLKTARETQGDDPRIAVGLAQAYLAMGKAADAASACADAQRSGNTPPALQWHHAVALQRLGKAAESLRELEALYAQEPEFDGLRLMLGQSLVRAGRREEGKRLLDAHRAGLAKANRRAQASLRVSMNPKDAQAHLAMARIYSEEGNDGRMRAEANRALELNPGLEEASRLLAEARP